MSNGNKFRGGNDYQVSQWNDCARLISNCLINYNGTNIEIMAILGGQEIDDWL
jgi:hypothetical protein